MKDLYESFLGLLDILPSIERDIFMMYYLWGFSQSEISSFLGLSQPTICYRLQKGLERLKFRCHLPIFQDEELKTKLLEKVESENAEIAFWFVKTTSQSTVAQKFGYSQGFVRYRIYKMIGEFGEGGEGYLAFLLEYVSKNLNVSKDLARVSLEEK